MSGQCAFIESHGMHEPLISAADVERNAYEKQRGWQRHDQRSEPRPPIVPQSRMAPDDQAEYVEQRPPAALSAFREITQDGVALIPIQQPGRPFCQ